MFRRASGLLSIMILLTCCSHEDSRARTADAVEASASSPATTSTPTAVRRPPPTDPTVTETTRSSPPPTTKRANTSRDTRISGEASGGQRACARLKGLLGQIHTADDLYASATHAQLTSILDQIVAAEDLSLLYQSSFVRDALQTSQNPALPQMLSQLYDACAQAGYVTR